MLYYLTLCDSKMLSLTAAENIKKSSKNDEGIRGYAG